MKLFKEKIKLCHEAYYAEDYLACSRFLEEAYIYWFEQYGEIPLPTEVMRDGLLVAKGLLELPELDPTDYTKGIIYAENTMLNEHHATRIGWGLHAFRELTHHLRIVIQYLEEYLGHIGQSSRPSITVGIDEPGKYSFYQNIYQDLEDSSPLGQGRQ
jgi:hypothetical protein